MDRMTFLNVLLFVLLAAKEDSVLAKVTCPRDFVCDCKDITSGGHVSRVIDCSNRSLVSLPYFGSLTGESFDEILLNDNKITSLPSGSFRGLTVSKMDLSNNNIRSFSDIAFADVPGLSELIMVNCGLKSISSSFGKLTNMTRLDLHNNKITQINPRSFLAMTELEYLDLHHNPLDFGSPFEAFKNLKKLKELHLQHCGIFNLPIEAVNHMIKLVHLDLGHNRMRNIPEKLLSYFPDLKFLDMSENPLRITPSAEMFKGIKHVETLKFSGCFVKDQKIDKHLFSRVKHVKKLVFGNCNLTEIADGTFADLRHLHYLDISGNKVTIKPEMFKGVKDTLHTLKLNNMDLSSYPSDLLWDISSLKRVYVENNKISKLPERIFSHFKYADSSVHLSGNKIRSISNRILRGAIRPASVYLQDTGLKNLEFITENPCSFWESTLDVSDNELICDCDVYSAMQMKVGEVHGICSVPELYEGLQLDWRPGREPESEYLTRHVNATETCSKADRSGQKYDCGCKTWIDYDSPEMCPYIDTAASCHFSMLLVILSAVFVITCSY